MQLKTTNHVIVKKEKKKLFQHTKSNANSLNTTTKASLTRNNQLKYKNTKARRVKVST